MRIDVVSIFPEYLAALDLSLIGKARRDGLIDLAVHDLRDYTYDRHRTVDDTPYGGGAGMVMKAQPWSEVLERIDESGPLATRPVGDAPAAAATVDDASSTEAEAAERPVLIVPSPAGAVFNQAMAYDLAEHRHLVFACGRYEGIDERVIEWAEDRFDVRPVSLGDYVLNGGEVAVLAMVEAVGRLLPGVVGNPDSLVEESHSDGLLEYPVYTKPAQWQERDVPEVLLSGNHARIARWRRDQQLRRTADRRPDLILELDPESLDKADRVLLGELGFRVAPEGVQPHVA
ncbi:tRNA (guanosine(37)-N1)-methyltransferase TrmD [Zhihengliuella alba]|uniref:tRNA (guanine-N(1)-)-methyltransferase n=1 Tax=Zhihengliuella alba TaxID=547018 RepID=A0ABP7CS61_9MICC